MVNTILQDLRENDGITEYVRQEWSCKDLCCSLGIARDLNGFPVGLFVFLEMILAHRYKRSFKAYKFDTGATIIAV